MTGRKTTCLFALPALLFFAASLSAAPLGAQYNSDVVLSLWTNPARLVSASVTTGGAFAATGTWYYATQPTNGLGAGVLSAISNATVTATGQLVRVQWTFAGGADGVRIWRGAQATNLASFISQSAGATNFSDTGTNAWTAGTNTVTATNPPGIRFPDGSRQLTAAIGGSATNATLLRLDGTNLNGAVALANNSNLVWRNTATGLTADVVGPWGSGGGTTYTAGQGIAISGQIIGLSNSVVSQINTGVAAYALAAAALASNVWAAADATTNYYPLTNPSGYISTAEGATGFVKKTGDTMTGKLIAQGTSPTVAAIGVTNGIIHVSGTNDSSSYLDIYGSGLPGSYTTNTPFLKFFHPTAGAGSGINLAQHASTNWFARVFSSSMFSIIDTGNAGTLGFVTNAVFTGNIAGGSTNGTLTIDGAAFATGTPLYVESDPNWAANSNRLGAAGIATASVGYAASAGTAATAGVASNLAGGAFLASYSNNVVFQAVYPAQVTSTNNNGTNYSTFVVAVTSGVNEVQLLAGAGDTVTVTAANSPKMYFQPTNTVKLFTVNATSWPSNEVGTVIIDIYFGTTSWTWDTAISNYNTIAVNTNAGIPTPLFFRRDRGVNFVRVKQL